MTYETMKQFEELDSEFYLTDDEFIGKYSELNELLLEEENY